MCEGDNRIAKIIRAFLLSWQFEFTAVIMSKVLSLDVRNFCVVRQLSLYMF
jgi:hypothetical protein